MVIITSPDAEMIDKNTINFFMVIKLAGKKAKQRTEAEIMIFCAAIVLSTKKMTSELGDE
jgi:hypothetical protein